MPEKEGVKGEQRTGKVTEDGDEASAQIMGTARGPMVEHLLKRRDDVDGWWFCWVKIYVG